MVRQCYAPGEEASFNRVYRLLAAEAHRQGLAPETLRAWKRADAALRSTHLDHLILVKAAVDKHIPPNVAEDNGHDPVNIESPYEMLSTVFYGDGIHWGDSRTVIDS